MRNVASLGLLSLGLLAGCIAPVEDGEEVMADEELVGEEVAPGTQADMIGGRCNLGNDDEEGEVRCRDTNAGFTGGFTMK